MTELRASDLASAAWVAIVLTGATAATALVAHLVAADTVRDLLGLTFEGVPRRPAEVVDIAANNVRVLVAVLIACALAQVARAGRAGGWEGAFGRAVTVVCDVALVTGCGVNVLLVGLALGAHGVRVLELVIAHAPFELVAFSLALGLYLDGRRAPLPARRLVGVAVVAPAALAVGALLEVYA